MDVTILGSGGCMVIPKPLCDCRICSEARKKGVPYERTGPSAFIHDENILIDTPAEISIQLNRAHIMQVDNLMFTHLDPDHIEGFRVVEQIALDFRTWQAFPEKQIRLILPVPLMDQLRNVQSAYGSLLDYYVAQKFITCVSFEDSIVIGDIRVTAIPVDRGEMLSFIYVFEKAGRKMVYAPCDIRPFPENHEKVARPDLFVVQPGLFEKKLRHGFIYPTDHISRTTLYTFEETLALAERIQADQILFVHLEEYWNRSHSDYAALQNQFENVRFAWDGMQLSV